jgi:hypothetical protein
MGCSSSRLGEEISCCRPRPKLLNTLLQLLRAFKLLASAADGLFVVPLGWRNQLLSSHVLLLPLLREHGTVSPYRYLVLRIRIRICIAIAHNKNNSCSSVSRYRWYRYSIQQTQIKYHIPVPVRQNADLNKKLKYYRYPGLFEIYFVKLQGCGFSFTSKKNLEPQSH